MPIPIIQGVIDRRILANFRVDPEILARIVPHPFRPLLVNGQGMAGICLIRLSGIRPSWWPASLGIGSENAAHRMAVEWDEGGSRRHGVYVARRDSSSLWNALAGGRLFPGVHHHSRFSVRETPREYYVEVSNADGTHVVVEGQTSNNLPAGSVFGSLERASEFFANGSVGYSPARRRGVFEGLELRTSRWEMTPLATRRAESSFFSDPAIFPPGSVEFDCALLMREIPHEWHGRGRMTSCTDTAAIPG